MKRKSSFNLTTKEQLQVVLSPICNEIVQALRVAGPSSASELGVILGKNANSLHYHLRKLIAHELVNVVATRQSGARTERIYDLSADRFVSDEYLQSEPLRKIVVKGIKGFLRLAGREFESATKASGKPEKTHPRKLIGSRYSANLNDEQLTELNRHVEEISRIFAENSGSNEGERYTFTSILAPVGYEQNQDSKE